ncbi:MAG: chorismate synthase [Bacteroidaceae bacterium]|nr:chorismate synthase [Bacteroidaceae bacterium]
MMNTFGNILKLTSFGESHCPAIGGVIDGFPANIDIDVDFIQSELNRRRPGTSKLTTSRNEADAVEFLSGIFNGKSTGCPIGFIIRNNDAHSNDYSSIKDLFRPSHADYTYDQKYGIRDYRGGGRASARETAIRVVGGAMAKLLLNQIGVNINARISQIGNVVLNGTKEECDKQYSEIVSQVKAEGDSIGGIISCSIQNCPVGLGEPIYGKLHAALGFAMLSINAVKGFDYGMGFDGIGQKGSELNDIFYNEGDGIKTKTNNSGGIQGGISNGEEIYFRVAFKPVPTIMQDQQTVDKQGNNVVFKAKGRHDPCVLQRALPVVESMAALVIADYYLLNKTNKI